jgi:hypothetical protein
MKWKCLNDKKDALAVLYSNNKFVIWEPQFGIKLWSKNLTTNMNKLAIDTHCISGRIAS